MKTQKKVAAFALDQPSPGTEIVEKFMLVQSVGKNSCKNLLAQVEK